MIRLLKGFNTFRFATELSLSSPPPRRETASGRDKYRNYRQTGPELLITRILMVNGPLNNKEIWRIYEKKLHDAKIKGIETEDDYWPSLTKMKETIRFMRLNQKVKTGGYTYKSHHFNGWQIQEKRALEYVHPIVIYEIQQEIAKK